MSFSAHCRLGLSVSALFIAIPAVHAQSAWTGASSNLWTDVGNWSAGVPGSGNTALFNAASPNTTISLGGAAQPIGNIMFDTAAAPAYTLGVLNSGDAFTVGPGGAITVNNTVTALQAINANLNSTGAMTLSNSGSATGGLTIGGNIAVGGALNLTNGVANTTMTINGNITGATSVVYSATTSGAGNNNNFVINGTNTYTAPTTLTLNTGSAGSLQLGTDSPFGTGKVTLNVATGANAPQIKALNGARVIPNAIDINAGLTLVGSGSLAFSGPLDVISSTAQRTYNSSLAGLTFTFGSAASPSTLTLGNPVSNGGDNVAKLGIFNAVANAMVVLNDNLRDPAPGGNPTVIMVRPQGAGTVQFNGQSTYTGITDLSGANTIVQVGTSSNGPPGSFTAGPFGVGTVQTNNGTNSTIEAIGGDQTISNQLTLLTGATFGNAPTTGINGDPTGPHNLTWAGPVTFASNPVQGRTINVNMPGKTFFLGSAANPSTLTLNTAGNNNLAFVVQANTTLVINDVIQDGAGLADTLAFNNATSGQTAYGTVVINGASTFTGGTTINGGFTGSPATFLIGVSSNAPFTAGPFGVGPLTTANTSGPPIFVPVGADRTIANAITMTSGFFVANAAAAQDPTGPHNLALTGNITIGTISRTLTNNMVAGVALTLGSAANPATINLGNSMTLQSQSGIGDPAAGVTIINDLITGAGGLTIQTGGTVQLTNGGNNYAGVTNVTGGKLLVNNTSGSATSTGAVNVTGSGTVGSGGILGGTGIIAGPVTLSAATAGTPNTQGGTVSPGNSIGTLKVASMTFNPLGQYIFEHNATSNATGGTTNDFINGTGNLELASLFTNGTFTINLAPTSFSPAPVQMDYTVATFAGGITGAGGVVGAPIANGTDVSSLFTLAGAFTAAPAQYATVVGAAGGPQSLVISITPVPEPTAVLAACGAIAGLAAWRRKRVAV